MNRIARRAGITMLLALLLIAGFSFFLCEFAARADEWVVFSGSPHVYNGGNIGCGSIVDRDGVLLLDMQEDRTYTEDALLRKSVVHWVGDRNGSISAPALSGYSSELAGFDYLNGVYNYAQNGGYATLTLSGKVQKVALSAMGERKGTVAVYNYITGEILCAVTTPTFDPDNLPEMDEETIEQYEGLFYNRFTQSTYTPGSIYKIVTLAAALEHNPEILEQKFICTGSYKFGEDEITCEGIHFDQDLKMAFRNSCNCAFAQIVEQLGPDVLSKYIQQFKINESVRFDHIATTAGNVQINNGMDASVAWSGIGQHKDLINPCAYMTFMGAIAAGGKGAQPYIVEKITVGETVTHQGKTVVGERLMKESTAKILQEYLRFNVEDKYGTYNFPDMTVCAKTGTGEVSDEKKPNAMLSGFVLDEKYPLAFIACVEEGGYGSTTCIPIVSQVLSACKEVIDS